MDRKLLGILAGTGLVMALTAWLAYPKSPPEPPLQDRRFMHCSKCGRELPYSTVRAEKGCPQCGDKTKLVASKESIVQAGGLPSPWPRIFAPLFIEANILIAMLLMWYRGRARSQLDQDDFLYVPCHHCGQKLRYRPKQIGRAGLCPRCKTGLVFPPADEESQTTTRWWQPRRVWQSLKGKVRGTKTSA